MNRTYPGMACDAIEIFIDNDDKLKAIENGQVKNFTDLSFFAVGVLREYIQKDDLVRAALLDFHPNSEIKRLEQFARCRFGGLDFEGDIVSGNLQDGEYWPCPFHGNCKYEGILCKLPKVNGQRLSQKEIKILKLTQTDVTNDVMADILNMCLGTFHMIKKELYKKLGIQTKQEATLVAIDKNIR